MDVVARLVELRERMQAPDGFRPTRRDVETVSNAAVLIDALETALGKAAALIKKRNDP